MSYITPRKFFQIDLTAYSDILFVPKTKNKLEDCHVFSNIKNISPNSIESHTSINKAYIGTN